jgi:nucleoside-diphosphate-sugar epimerase
MIADALRKRRMPINGIGDAEWAMIHSDVAASAYVVAAEKPTSSVWHIVDDELVQVRTFLKDFAARLGAPLRGAFPSALCVGSLGAGRRVFHPVDADDQRSLPPRFRLDAALSHVSRRVR